jgi:hypothetical protein
MAHHVRLQREGNKVHLSIEWEMPAGAPMMECERQILSALNEAGGLATGECLGRFDTDGSTIEVGGIKLTSKGQVPKTYQTPYGERVVSRHVYQSSDGGQTYCPLDHAARIVASTTPRFAQMCARKYATLNSVLAQADLAEGHQREVSRCYLQDIAEAVGAIAQAQGEAWTYAEPPLAEAVARIGLGIDGTCLLYCEAGWREAMVGTISLYDRAGERLHTVYVGAAPEYGKERFLARMEREIALYKERYSAVPWVGIADGAKDYWPWLERFADHLVLDFFHAAGYLEKASEAMDRAEPSAWFEQSRHALKKETGGASRLLSEMRTQLGPAHLRGSRREALASAVSYFENHLPKMDYARHRRAHRPIGSGVTEAACKTLVKQRLCGSGMKWKQTGAATVLALRSLILTAGRWEQFWSKVSRFGC